MANINKPKDDNIDNIIREFVNVQDETCPEEYTNEVDKILKTLTALRTDEITTMMPAHRLVEWNKYVTGLEHLTTSCFENIQRAASSNEPNIPVTRSTDAIPITSCVSRDATTTTNTTTTTTTTIITTMNESIDNHSDEVNTTMEDLNFGTENTESLESHIVQLSRLDISTDTN